ncbi:hypothetical protein MP228_003955 [Amoeboaphelidium protococcarum]|nr:hypothetical protein MP228_003955 [Amoeboaphelidium protococcarum]
MRRSNGWQSPYAKRFMFMMVMMAFTLILVVKCPLILDDTALSMIQVDLQQLMLVRILSLMIPLSVYSFCIIVGYMIISRDIGLSNIGTEVIDEFSQSVSSPVQLNPQIKRCFKCSLEVSIDTIHCRYCDKCIPRMDHHCFFLNTCIGQVLRFALYGNLAFLSVFELNQWASIVIVAFTSAGATIILVSGVYLLYLYSFHFFVLGNIKACVI